MKIKDRIKIERELKSKFDKILFYIPKYKLKRLKTSFFEEPKDEFKYKDFKIKHPHLKRWGIPYK
jgi:hypothetical protein